MNLNEFLTLEEQAPVSKAVNINKIAVFAEQWLAKA